MNGDPSICNGCGLGEPEIRFRLRRMNGKTYRKHLCTKCEGEYKEKYRSLDVRARENKRSAERQKSNRLLPRSRGRFILYDSRKSDKNNGRENDLDYNFIVTEIEKGCKYCGQSEGVMTLDRVDNSVGHLKSNVEPACMRCNYIRKDMPYEAWKIIVPSIKEARESGAFGNWDGFGRKKKVTDRGQDDNAAGC